MAGQTPGSGHISRKNCLSVSLQGRARDCILAARSGKWIGARSGCCSRGTWLLLWDGRRARKRGTDSGDGMGPGTESLQSNPTFEARWIGRQTT
jgi:hypothetical protein